MVVISIFVRNVIYNVGKDSIRGSKTLVIKVNAKDYKLICSYVHCINSFI